MTITITTHWPIKRPRRSTDLVRVLRGGLPLVYPKLRWDVQSLGLEDGLGPRIQLVRESNEHWDVGVGARLISIQMTW